MDKKSTHVKTYELRQNDLCIILKQLDPASNKNYGEILHKVRQFVRICICCKTVTTKLWGKCVKMLDESQKTSAQIRQRKKCTQTHFFCAFVHNLQWEEMQYAKKYSRWQNMCEKWNGNCCT